MISHHIRINGGGYHVVWYDDDDTERVSYWYGSREACEARAAQPPPPARDFWPVTGDGSVPSDAATATGMYDHDY